MPDDRTYGFNVDDAAALLQSIGTGESTYQETRPRGGGGKLAVILDAALPAATNAKTGASSCLATVCVGTSTAGALAEADQITVWNHSEVANHEADTFGYAEMIAGHWHFLGDCHPMASR
jgi:hypothetical protein